MVARLNLTGENELLTILSGRESTVRLFDSLLENDGHPPADWMRNCCSGQPDDGCPAVLNGGQFLVQTLAHLDCQAQTLGSFGFQSLPAPGAAGASS